MPSMLLESPEVSLRIAFDERVLAPRPWTMAQAAWGAALWRTTAGGPALELCSGVGHIGLALATQAPVELVMVDASEVACAFARKNAAEAGLTDRVTVRCGPLDATLAPDERFDLVLADPPWVPTDDVPGFPGDPVHAIDGGDDGMDLVRSCLRTIDAHLSGAGRALLQVGPGQVDAVRAALPEDAPGLVVTAARGYGARGALVALSRRR